ncbi:MAG: TlyA family RNA methyltransferase, partial [Anaerolineae bacterium]
MGKKRIDTLLIEQNLARSPEHAAALLMSGRVFVNRQRVSVPGMLVDPLARISVKANMPYVSRGGYKLAAALDAFAINPAGAVCADVGASTGGFTDVLLHPRVVVMERTDARHVERLPQPVSLVVIDVSFISLKRILPAAQNWIEPRADFAVLVKPQFEASKAKVEAGGVVKNRATHAAVLNDIIGWCNARGLAVHLEEDLHLAPA